METISIAMAVFGFLVKALPLIEQLVQVAEATFNIPQQGKDKLEYVMSELKLVFQAEQTIAQQVSWDRIAPFLSRNIAAKAKLLFPSQTTPASH